MKHSNITKNRTRVPLLLVLAASIIGLAPAFSLTAWAGSGSYSINDVSGNYVDLGNGWTYGTGGLNDKQSVPLSFVGLITFTPDTSTFHEHNIVREYGTNHVVDFDGTYTVDSDGHGTMTWLSLLGNIKNRDFYIVNAGAELKYNDTDPPGTVIISDSGTMTKQ